MAFVQCSATHPETGERCKRWGDVANVGDPVINHRFHVTTAKPWKEWPNEAVPRDPGSLTDMQSMVDAVKGQPGAVGPYDVHQGTTVVLDREAADQASRDGQQIAFDGAEEEWKQLARAAIRQVIATHDEFCPDDVWRTGLPMPREGRALGPIIMEFARRGEIEKTGRSVLTEQVKSHARDVNVWRVLRRSGPVITGPRDLG